MRRTARRSWPLAAVLVFVAIGTAAAECAWVLWYEEHGWVSAGLLPSPSEAFATQSDCEARMRRRVTDAQKFVSDMNDGAGAARSFQQAISGDGAAVTITTTDARDGGTWTIQMRCLPDTIDPRNAKGQ